jgi:hypothetical protein
MSWLLSCQLELLGCGVAFGFICLMIGQMLMRISSMIK